MKVGVIGIGNIGGTIARRLAANGHQLRVANSRGREAARLFAEEIGAEPTDARGAAKDVDAVILSIPFFANEQLPRDLFAGLPPHVPVIDTGNYAPPVGDILIRDRPIPDIDAGMTESVWVARYFARPITKAFNNIHDENFINFGRSKGDPARIALSVAGDDANHKRIAMEIIEEMGFDSVDAGSLEESWRQQMGTPAFCCDWTAEEMKRALASAIKGEGPKRRDLFVTDYGEWFAAGRGAHEITELQRKLNAT